MTAVGSRRCVATFETDLRGDFFLASDQPADGFYVVGSPRFGSQNDSEWLPSADARYGNAPRCPECGRFIGARVWLPPFRVELALHGSDWGDFAFAGDSFLVSTRVVESAQRVLRGLEGFESVEVVRFAPRERPPPAYFRVDLPDDGADIDEDKSAITRADDEPGCDRCRSDADAIDGFVLEAGTWTGADLFHARGLPGVPIASDRFKHLAYAEAWSNVELTPTGSFRWDPVAPVS